MSDIIEPGTAEWFEARCGRVSASRVHEATARGAKGQWLAPRANYLAELAVERLTGIATQHFVSPAMQWGIEKEPDARSAYEYLFDVEVAPVGFRQHLEIHQSGATPDGGLSGQKILVEFKCPTSQTHIETILTKEIDPKYKAQMAWQLACFPEYEAVDYGTFDPRMPPELRLWVFRFTREANAKYIAQLEADVRTFLSELDDMVDKLRATGRMEKAA
jgi:hypothetical protein